MAWLVNPPRPGRIQRWDYQDQQIVIRKGEEMGRFQLGSTVVLLFPARPACILMPAGSRLPG
jgi:phosphatidylserine decarboxylase